MRMSQPGACRRSSRHVQSRTRRPSAAVRAADRAGLQRRPAQRLRLRIADEVPVLARDHLDADAGQALQIEEAADVSDELFARGQKSTAAVLDARVRALERERESVLRRALLCLAPPLHLLCAVRGPRVAAIGAPL